jgi:hypothetical protein
MCVIVSGITLTNGAGSNVSADIKNIASSVEKGSNAAKFSLDSKHKEFYDLADLKDYVNFDFNLPSFIPDGYNLNMIKLDETADNNQDIEISWFNKEHKYFVLEVSKANLLDEYKNSKTKNFDLSVKKEQMQVGNTSGTGVSLNYTYPEGMKSDAKAFVWKDNGMFYNLVYSQGAEGAVPVIVLSNNDLNKIVTSLKNFREVKYSSDYGDKNLSIYSEKDMNKAEEILGFTPKFPLKISDNYALTGAKVNYGNALCLTYNNKLLISQTKGTSTFEKIIKEDDSDLVKNSSFKRDSLHKVTINNIITYYRHIDKNDFHGAEVVYFWTRDGISYSTTIPGNDENHKIIESVLDSLM